MPATVAVPLALDGGRVRQIYDVVDATETVLTEGILADQGGLVQQKPQPIKFGKGLINQLIPVVTLTTV